MKKSFRSKIMLISGISITVFTLIFTYFGSLAKITNAEEIDEFSNLLTTNNITVVGSNSNMTHFQLTGLVNMLNTDSISVIKKYNKKLSIEGDTIVILPVEILELQYYSMTTDEQKAFLTKVSNQKVDISMKDGSILTSYNVNE